MSEAASSTRYLVRQQLGGWLVDEVTVFDSFDSGSDRLPDCTRCVCVHGYIGAPIFSGFNGSMDLRFGELGAIQSDYTAN